MNNHSFINMARVVDDNKLVAIKESFMRIIINEGYTNASISKIAKEAKVSTGYLYRHYDSKESLVLSIYVEQFEKLKKILMDKIASHLTLRDVIFGFYQEIIHSLREHENDILFLLKMMMDYSIAISEDMKQDLKKVSLLIQEKFSDNINSQLRGEHIYVHVLGNILLFINLRKKNIFTGRKITHHDIKLLTQTTINALK